MANRQTHSHSVGTHPTTEGIPSSVVESLMDEMNKYTDNLIEIAIFKNKYISETKLGKFLEESALNTANGCFVDEYPKLKNIYELEILSKKDVLSKNRTEENKQEHCKSISERIKQFKEDSRDEILQKVNNYLSDPDTVAFLTSAQAAIVYSAKDQISNPKAIPVVGSIEVSFLYFTNRFEKVYANHVLEKFNNNLTNVEKQMHEIIKGRRSIERNSNIFLNDICNYNIEKDYNHLSDPVEYKLSDQTSDPTEENAIIIERTPLFSEKNNSININSIQNEVTNVVR